MQPPGVGVFSAAGLPGFWVGRHLRVGHVARLWIAWRIQNALDVPAARQYKLTLQGTNSYTVVQSHTP